MSSPSEFSLRKACTIIRCECGFEILLVPDLKMMAKAIESHAAQHGKKEKDAVKAASERERIERALVSQTLKAASELY